jgi:hypothetical protein
MDPSYIGVPEFIKSGKEVKPGKINPIQLADSIQSFCTKAILEVNDINPESDVD